MVSEGLKEAASSRLAFIEKYSHAPSPSRVADWLTSLLPMIETAKNGEDVQDRIGALSQGLDYPAYCYTQENLFAFAKKHKFLPAMADVAAFFDEVVRKTEKEADRCRRILNGDKKKKTYEGPDYPVGDERKRLADKFAELRKSLCKDANEVTV